MGEVVEKAEITPLCWHSLCTYLDQLSSPLGLISYDSGLAQVISLHLCLLLPDALGFRYSAGGKEKIICHLLHQMGPEGTWMEVQRCLFWGRWFGI